jgi:hypothetical protein
MLAVSIQLNSDAFNWIAPERTPEDHNQTNNTHYDNDVRSIFTYERGTNDLEDNDHYKKPEQPRDRIHAKEERAPRRDFSHLFVARELRNSFYWSSPWLSTEHAF